MKHAFPRRDFILNFVYLKSGSHLFMIDLNNLRIGNWISLPLHGILTSAHRIIDKDETGIYIVNGSQDEFLPIHGTFPYEKEPTIKFLLPSEIKGTPLSVQMLINCGFQLRKPGQEQGIYKYYSLENFTVITSGSILQWTITESSGNVPIKFVHELQNLYFKVMNKELDIIVPPFNFQIMSKHI